MSATRVSFVVPVRDDAVRLKRCLASINAGVPAGVDVEIVVADNGSVDDSAVVARAAGARVLELPGVRLGELRNRAAAAATGDILAFVDADHEIGPDWIACAVDAFRDPEAGAIGAPCRAPSPGTWVQQVYDRLRRHPASREQVEWLGSGNMAVRRSAFHTVGGFDTTLETCEDVDLCRKLRGAGFDLYSDRRMLNIHYGDPSTLGQVFYGELWRGRDNLRVSLRAPVTGRTLVSAAMPVANLSAMVLVASGLLAGGRMGRTAAAAGLLYLAAGVALRATAMTRRGQPVTDWAAACAVAAAYEAGRALAVAGRFGYRRRRRPAVA
jgi:hypothetical protein